MRIPEKVIRLLKKAGDSTFLINEGATQEIRAQAKRNQESALWEAEYRDQQEDLDGAAIRKQRNFYRPINAEEESELLKEE